MGHQGQSCSTMAKDIRGENETLRKAGAAMRVGPSNYAKGKCVGKNKGMSVRSLPHGRNGANLILWRGQTVRHTTGNLKYKKIRQAPPPRPPRPPSTYRRLKRKRSDGSSVRVERRRIQ